MVTKRRNQIDMVIGSIALINLQGEINECDSFQSEIGQCKTPEFN